MPSKPPVPPALAYHVSRTPEAVEEFRPFTHFGTAKAAFDRGMGATVSASPGATLHEVELGIRHPLVVRDLVGADHSWVKLVDMLHYTLRKITSEERNEVFRAAAERGASDPHAGDEALAALLMSRGWDGLCYVNGHEDPGSLSWIVLAPGQVRVVRSAPFAAIVSGMRYEGTLPDRDQGVRPDPDGSASAAVVGSLTMFGVLDGMAPSRRRP